MSIQPALPDQIDAVTGWIDRLQHVQEAMMNPQRFGQEVVSDLLQELKPDPVLGNIFRLRLDTGHAIRITLEMCVVESS